MMASKDKVPYKPPQYISDRPIVPDAGWMLDWYLARHREAWNSWEQAENPTWRASSLGNCLRQQTLQRRGVPSARVIDDKTQRAFAWGDEVHKFIRKVFWRLGVVIEEEVDLASPSMQVVGHADLVWTPGGYTRDDEAQVSAEWSEEWNLFLTAIRQLFQDDLAAMRGVVDPSEVIGSEFKSAHSMAMKRMLNEGPHEHHKAQVAAYHLMAKEADPPIALADRWLLTYIGKDSVGTLTFEMEEAWVEDALDRLTKLNQFWTAGRLPPCTCQGWQVDYCPYNEGDLCCGRNLKGAVARALRKVEANA
jgi:hypothetical protein